MTGRGRLSAPSIWTLTLFWLILLVQIQLSESVSVRNGAIYPHHRIRRDDSMPVQSFLEKLKTEPMDLIILMERSKAIGRYYLNFRTRRLVSHVLRYYTKIGPSNVRLVVATFAKGFTIHINGMEDPSLNKCDIFDTHWENVGLDDNDDKDKEWEFTGVKNAYEKSIEIFRNHGSPGNKRYIWLLTSGDYKNSRDGDPENATNILTRKENVTIFATKSGHIIGLIGQIRSILNDNDNFGGNVTAWLTTLNNVQDLTETDESKFELVDQLNECYCDVTFGFKTCGLCSAAECSMCSTNTRDCICIDGLNKSICSSSSVGVCYIHNAMTGRNCQTRELQCVKNACANGGSCYESGSQYKCTCLGNYLPSLYCQVAAETTMTQPIVTKVITVTQEPTTNEKGIDILMIAYIAGGSGAFLLLVLIISICLCCRRKKKQKKPPTAEMATYTVSTGIGVGTDDIEYSEIPSIPTNLPPRSRPTAVIKPKPKPPPKPAKSANLLEKLKNPYGRVPSLLLSVPVPGQEELKLPNPKVNNQGDDVHSGISTYTNQRDAYRTMSSTVSSSVAGSTLSAEDMDVYENADSKGMAGWDKYIQELNTASGLKSFAIIRFNSEAYATTSTVWFLPTPDEMSNIYKVINSKKKKAVISILNANYRVTKNDGRMLEAFSLGTSPDILCIGMSKQYLTLGVKTDPENSGECFNEVKWVRDNLSKQGK